MGELDIGLGGQGTVIFTCLSAHQPALRPSGDCKAHIDEISAVDIIWMSEVSIAVCGLATAQHGWMACETVLSGHRDVGFSTLHIHSNSGGSGNTAHDSHTVNSCKHL